MHRRYLIALGSGYQIRCVRPPMDGPTGEDTLSRHASTRLATPVRSSYHINMLHKVRSLNKIRPRVTKALHLVTPKVRCGICRMEGSLHPFPSLWISNHGVSPALYKLLASLLDEHVLSLGPGQGALNACCDHWSPHHRSSVLLAPCQHLRRCSAWEASCQPTSFVPGKTLERTLLTLSSLHAGPQSRRYSGGP